MVREDKNVLSRILGTLCRMVHYLGIRFSG